MEDTISKYMKQPRLHSRGIFSLRFVGSGIPPKRKTLRCNPRTHAPGVSRRGINQFIFPFGLFAKTSLSFAILLYSSIELLSAFVSHSRASSFAKILVAIVLSL